MSRVHRYAANRVLSERGMFCDAVVEVSGGVVTAITELSSLNHETAATVFLNGTMTAHSGEQIYVGYSGDLYIDDTLITIK